MLSQARRVSINWRQSYAILTVPIVTPTKQISAELVTLRFVLGSEHSACKLFMGKELELGVLLSMVVEHIKSQAPAPGTSSRH